MLLLLIATFSAVVFSLAFTPLVRDAFLRLGIVDPPGDRKLHLAPVPRVGGIAIVLAYALTWLIVVVLAEVMPRITEMALPTPQPMLIGAVAVVFAIGLLDDLVGLNAWQKLAGQGFAAFLAWSGGLRIEVLSGVELGDGLSFGLTIFWLVACSNAFNLIDGLDGLAAGLALFATCTTLVSAVSYGSIDLMFATVPLIGALIGFLRYNFNKASIFLGDCGSLTLGFVLGCFGVCWGQKSATLLGMTAPVMALSIPLIDTSLAIVRRFLRNQPLFDADRGHIHHRLLDNGLSPKRAALLMYSSCCLAAAFALIQNIASVRFGGLLLFAFVFLLVVVLRALNYPELSTAMRLLLRGRFRRDIQRELRLAHLTAALDVCQSVDDAWDVLRSSLRSAGVLGIRLSDGAQDRSELFGSSSETGWSVRVPVGFQAEVELLFDTRFQSDAPVAALALLVSKTFAPYYTPLTQPTQRATTDLNSPGVRPSWVGSAHRIET